MSLGQWLIIHLKKVFIRKEKKKKAINVFDNFFYFQAIEVSLFLRKLLASPGQ